MSDQTDDQGQRLESLYHEARKLSGAERGEFILREAGHDHLADDIAETLVGRDTVGGQWTFQVVESFDSGYWRVFRDAEEYARSELGVPARHVHEAEMKHREQDGREGPAPA